VIFADGRVAEPVQQAWAGKGTGDFMIPDTATLVLEDGTILRGEAFGAQADAVFELVFNTSMTGYRRFSPIHRIAGRACCSPSRTLGMSASTRRMSNRRFRKSRRSSCARSARSFRTGEAMRPLSDWLAEQGVPGIGEVDTRYITRKLREGGTLRARSRRKARPATTLIEMAQPGPAWRDRIMCGE